VCTARSREFVCVLHSLESACVLHSLERQFKYFNYFLIFLIVSTNYIFVNLLDNKVF